MDASVAKLQLLPIQNSVVLAKMRKLCRSTRRNLFRIEFVMVTQFSTSLDILCIESELTLRNYLVMAGIIPP